MKNANLIIAITPVSFNAFEINLVAVDQKVEVLLDLYGETIYNIVKDCCKETLIKSGLSYQSISDLTEILEDVFDKEFYVYTYVLMKTDLFDQTRIRRTVKITKAVDDFYLDDSIKKAS